VVAIGNALVGFSVMSTPKEKKRQNNF